MYTFKLKLSLCSTSVSLTILQLWFGWTASHLIRVGGGLLLIALAVTTVLIVASLLAVLWLVSSLGASIGVLLTVACLAEGIGGRLLFLRWDVCSREGGQPAGLLEDKPQVSYPQDHVDEAKSLRAERCLDTSLSVLLSTHIMVLFSVKTHHRGVKAGDFGVVDLTAAILWLVTS